MQKAAFSLIDYQFNKVIIDLENHTEKELNVLFKTEGVFFNQKSIYELKFDVLVNSNEIINPFVEVHCKGNYKFENCSTIQEIPDFFYRNCIAILFPYVRAYISLITTQANVPGIILPTLNLSGLENELKRNTIQN